MSNLNYRIYYERNLPHYQPPGATLFVTIRLAGSLPAHVIEELQKEKARIEAVLSKIPDRAERAQRTDEEQRRYFAKFDTLLDQAANGPVWLKDERIATLVSESLHYRNGTTISLDAFCIMSNHAHLVFKPLLQANGKYHALTKIMHSLKLHTALEGNKILHREGQFWQHESYGHVVRDEGEWRRIIEYVVYNPVKAGLVESWRDWPWTYCRYNL